MKKIRHTFSIFLMALVFSFSSLILTAQEEGEPTLPPSDPSIGGTKGAVGHPLDAPIGDALPLILGLALLYGAFQFSQVRSKSKIGG
jgi:hypothetical protein